MSAAYEDTSALNQPTSQWLQTWMFTCWNFFDRTLQPLDPAWRNFMELTMLQACHNESDPMLTHEMLRMRLAQQPALADSDTFRRLYTRNLLHMYAISGDQTIYNKLVERLGALATIDRFAGEAKLTLAVTHNLAGEHEKSLDCWHAALATPLNRSGLRIAYQYAQHSIETLGIDHEASRTFVERLLKLLTARLQPASAENSIEPFEDFAIFAVNILGLDHTDTAAFLDALAKQGRRLATLGQLQRALPFFDLRSRLHLHDNQCTDPRAPAELAAVYFKLKLFDEVEALLTQLIELEHKHGKDIICPFDKKAPVAVFLFVLGSVQFAQDKKTEAFATFDRCLERWDATLEQGNNPFNEEYIVQWYNKGTVENEIKDSISDYVFNSWSLSLINTGRRVQNFNGELQEFIATHKKALQEDQR